MTNLLKDLLKMLNNKENIFMIIECAESIGFEITSRSTPSIRAEIESFIANAEFECEAETLTVTFKALLGFKV